MKDVRMQISCSDIGRNHWSSPDDVVRNIKYCMLIEVINAFIGNPEVRSEEKSIWLSNEHFLILVCDPRISEVCTSGCWKFYRK
jgi:hypothetical protein